MPIKQILIGKKSAAEGASMDHFIGFGITGQPLLRKSVNPPEIWVKYVKHGVKRKRRFGSPACAIVFARETKGNVIVVITDGKTKQWTRYVNGVFIRTKTVSLEDLANKKA